MPLLKKKHIKKLHEQTLQILLNNANMEDLIPNVISDMMITEELNCKEDSQKVLKQHHALQRHQALPPQKK